MNPNFHHIYRNHTVNKIISQQLYQQVKVSSINFLILNTKLIPELKLIDPSGH